MGGKIDGWQRELGIDCFAALRNDDRSLRLSQAGVIINEMKQSVDGK
jgi:hypothetical protein